MAIHDVFPHLAAIWQALGLDDPAGMQLYAAQDMLAMYHPPLNPDVGVLLVLERQTALPDLQRVLRNQYPDEHTLRLVTAGEPAPDVQRLLLAELAGTDHGTDWGVLYVPPLPQAGSFECFQETIAHLRSPEGCPWDRKQTHASLRPYLLEETYEVLDALDSGSVDDLREELGDLLLQIVLHSQIAVDEGEFHMGDVIAHINAKLIHRHPHVWGDVSVDDENDVKANWDKLKQDEKNAKNGGVEQPSSRLDGVSKALPALSQSFSYQDRAARVNFDWDTIEPVIDKVREELEEVLTAPDDTARAGEVGDLLFAVVNLARWLNVDPESALRGTNARFYRRFNYIEQQAAAQARPLDEMSLAEMDELWEAAKSNGL